jgi:hypothetical protein
MARFDLPSSLLLRGSSSPLLSDGAVQAPLNSLTAWFEVPSPRRWCTSPSPVAQFELPSPSPMVRIEPTSLIRRHGSSSPPLSGSAARAPLPSPVALLSTDPLITRLPWIKITKISSYSYTTPKYIIILPR